MSDDSTPASGSTGPEGGPDLPPNQAPGSSDAAAAVPTVPSRKELRQQKGSPSAWFYALGGVGVLIVGAVVALLVTSGSSPSSASKPPVTVAPITAVPPTTMAPAPTCPLTGTPAPAEGGTNILGGQGSYLGTIVGVILITLLQSILSVMQIPEMGRQVTYGVVIIAMLLVYGRGRRQSN